MKNDDDERDGSDDEDGNLSEDDEIDASDADEGDEDDVPALDATNADADADAERRRHAGGARAVVWRRCTASSARCTRTSTPPAATRASAGTWPRSC